MHTFTKHGIFLHVQLIDLTAMELFLTQTQGESPLFSE